MSEPDSDPVVQYKLQLAAVEESLKHASDSEKASLLDLKEKLTEVIILLNGSQKEETASYNNESQGDTSLGSLDDEFLRFQKEIGALESNSSGGEKDIHENADEVHYELHKVLSSMEGKKCRAPFARQWGERAYHNAIIFSTDLEDQDVEDINNVQVKVMFCNPLCDDMKPCPFFLDGHCKFDAEKCRFSHGNSVKYSDLEEYVLPDYSNVQRDSRCLAKFKDGLWYTAIVENCLEGNKYVIKYDTCGSTDTLAAYDILPVGDLNLSDDDDDDSSSNNSFSGNAEEVKDMPLPSESVAERTEINYATEVGCSAIGTWEKHTNGIASKLMAKMGYVWGQGLGKNSDGRIEPVEAIVFPKGKSLDKCAELRDMSGPVSVEDKFAAEQIKEEERAKKIKQNSGHENTVFDFLNKNISRSIDDSQNMFRKRQSSGKISGPNKKCQSTNLNFEMYAVGEDIKKTKKEILRLQQSLSRNADRNGAACAHMKKQMTVQSNLLKRLEAKERKISNEINLKKDHKKIVSF